jgi:FtsP/CotA-like multicopper oxidase with cupredoxin domain
MPIRNPTRRALLGAGLAATAVRLRPARAQAEGFRTLRAEPDGYEAGSPGPILYGRRDEELKVRLVNGTTAPTSIHWHGVRVPNAMDGSALVQEPVAPGASFDYRFVLPDAGTFWYHPPRRTAENHALSGLLIVHEAEPQRSPNVDDDIALLVDHAGERFVANGVVPLDIPVMPQYRLRLRLANAANRLVTLRIDGHPMNVVAIDGQPCEPFLSRESRITLSPGNRADMLVDAVMKFGSVAPIVASTEGGDVALATIRYAEKKADPTATMPPGYAGEAIRPLTPNGLPERMDFRGALRVELLVDTGSAETPAKPLFSATRGRTVMLALANKSPAPVVTHIHGHHVRLLDRLDDGWKPFWLDTILCAPQQTTRVAFVADNPGKWLLQSRALGADGGTLAWFEVK